MKAFIIGAGTWGTALAQVLTDNSHDVTIFCRYQIEAYEINILHKNVKYFGEDVILSEKITATIHLSEIADADMVLLCVPTIAMRSVLESIIPYLNKKYLFINTAKGFDPISDKTMSNLIREIIPEKYRKPVVSLLGPSHAEEVIVRDLTCICSVSLDKQLAIEVSKIFSNSYLRVYPNDDEIGSEIGAAMKNAIAIASGILEGLNFGDNARAALCTRGLAEIVRFGVACGARKETYLGLTGLGDLVVTCYSFHSRNFKAGLSIGKDDSVTNFLACNTNTVEGLKTIDVIETLCKSMGVECPINHALYSIIYDNRKPSDVVSLIMQRPLREKE